MLGNKLLGVPLEREAKFSYIHILCFYSIDPEGQEGRKEKLFLRAAGFPIGPCFTSRWEPRFWCCMGFGVLGVSFKTCNSLFASRSCANISDLSGLNKWIQKILKSPHVPFFSSLGNVFLAIKIISVFCLDFSKGMLGFKYLSPTLLPCFKN